MDHLIPMQYSQLFSHGFINKFYHRARERESDCGNLESQAPPLNELLFLWGGDSYLLEMNCSSLRQHVSTGVLQGFLEHATLDCLAWGTDLFALR